MPNDRRKRQITVNLPVEVIAEIDRTALDFAEVTPGGHLSRSELISRALTRAVRAGLRGLL